MKKRTEKVLEKIMEKIHIENSFQDWIKNFSLNLNDIWKGDSARVLVAARNSKKMIRSAIVIGAGPSLTKFKHLEILAKSDYHGSIICTDRSLAAALKAGVTPKKFPKYYVVTIDPASNIKKFYKEKIIKKYGSKVNGVFTTVTNPITVNAAKRVGIKIHWVHALFDYDEGKKSFNQMSALMVRAKKHHQGLPAIQTGGNVGTASWFVAWQILKCSEVCLIGINHSWDESDSWDVIRSHCNAPKNLDKKSGLYKKIFPKIYNPEFDSYCILDPIFQYYSEALKEFILRSPSSVKTFNATEGGCIFGKRITCVTFSEFLHLHNKIL